MKLIYPAALALLSLSQACTALPQEPTEVTTQTSAPSLITKVSTADFATTEARLKAALDKRGLTLFTIVDHGAGADKAGLELGASKLYIFGNPKAGTLLMQANPEMGLDLPLKALVFEVEGKVMVSVSDIRAITERRNVSEPAQVITNVSNALAGILLETATPVPDSKVD
ncbi:MAG: DUF302 domain-containing protein [Pseudomonadota bacterium]